jgi:hypothetical protein
LAAGAQHKKDGLHASPVGLAGPAAAEAVVVGVGGQQDGDGLPQVVGKAPLFRNGSIVHDEDSQLYPANKYNRTQL